MSEELRPCPFCGLHKCKRCNYHIAGYEDKDVINQWNTRSAIRKEFCPNCEKETECEFTAELYECKECGEDFAKYIVSRKASVPDVSTTQDVLIDIKTRQSVENTNPDYYKDDVGKWIPMDALARWKGATLLALSASLLTWKLPGAGLSIGRNNNRC